MPIKHRLGPQNSSGSSGPEELLKIVNCATIKETERNNGVGPSGIGGWPPISTWIITIKNQAYYVYINFQCKQDRIRQTK
jgi:hypothetical protein